MMMNLSDQVRLRLEAIAAVIAANLVTDGVSFGDMTPVRQKLFMNAAIALWVNGDLRDPPE